MPTIGGARPGEQRGDGRDRVGQLAVRRAHGAVADRDRAADDGVDAEDLERDTDADDVDDRVERTDLVELDVIGVRRRGSRPRPRRGRGRPPVPDRERGRADRTRRSTRAPRAPVGGLCRVAIVGAMAGRRGRRARRRSPTVAPTPQRWTRSNASAYPSTPSPPSASAIASTSAPASTSDASSMSPATPAQQLNHTVRPRHRRSIRATAQAAPKPLSMPTTVTPLAHEACIASNAVTPSSAAP